MIEAVPIITKGQSSSLVELIATKLNFHIERISRKIPHEVFPTKQEH